MGGCPRFVTGLLLGEICGLPLELLPYIELERAGGALLPLPALLTDPGPATFGLRPADEDLPDLAEAVTDLGPDAGVDLNEFCQAHCQAGVCTAFANCCGMFETETGDKSPAAPCEVPDFVTGVCFRATKLKLLAGLMIGVERAASWLLSMPVPNGSWFSCTAAADPDPKEGEVVELPLSSGTGSKTPVLS